MTSPASLVAALLLGLACVVLVSVPVLPVGEILSKDGLDSYKYMVMGLQGPQAPQAHVASPFMYRVLFPWLSFASGLEPLAFFRAASLTSVALMVLAAWRIAIALQIRLDHVLLALSLALLTAVVKLCATAGYVTDLPLMAATMWAGYFFLRKWYGYMALLAAVMVANRELSFLLVLPALHEVWQACRRKAVPARTAVVQALILLAPAMVVLVLIRWMVGAPDQHLSALDAWHSSPFPRPAYWTGITGRLGGWLFPLCSLAFILRVERLKPILTMFMGGAAIALLQTLLGTDTSRLGATVLPLAVVLAAVALAKARLPWYGLIALFVMQYLSFVMDFTDPWLFGAFRQVIYVKYALAGASMACLLAMLAWWAWTSAVGAQVRSKFGILSTAK